MTEHTPKHFDFLTSTSLSPRKKHSMTDDKYKLNNFPELLMPPNLFRQLEKSLSAAKLTLPSMTPKMLGHVRKNTIGTPLEYLALKVLYF
jgi:hypothetical protein